MHHHDTSPCTATETVQRSKKRQCMGNTLLKHRAVHWDWRQYIAPKIKRQCTATTPRCAPLSKAVQSRHEKECPKKSSLKPINIGSSFVDLFETSTLVKSDSYLSTWLMSYFNFYIQFYKRKTKNTCNQRLRCSLLDPTSFMFHACPVISKDVSNHGRYPGWDRSSLEK